MKNSKKRKIKINKSNEEEVRLEAGSPDTPEYKSAWLAAKFQLGLDFPNLPYFLDGDVALCQSGAILRHLARKFPALGPADHERVRWGPPVQALEAVVPCEEDSAFERRASLASASNLDSTSRGR